MIFIIQLSPVIFWVNSFCEWAPTSCPFFGAAAAFGDGFFFIRLNFFARIPKISALTTLIFLKNCAEIFEKCAEIARKMRGKCAGNVRRFLEIRENWRKLGPAALENRAPGRWPENGNFSCGKPFFGKANFCYNVRKLPGNYRKKAPRPLKSPFPGQLPNA